MGISCSVVPADAVDEQAERGDRADHAERRQQDVPHERLPAVHHDLVTRRTGIRLAPPLGSLRSTTSTLCWPPELRRSTRTRFRAPTSLVPPARATASPIVVSGRTANTMRPLHLTGDRDANQRLHHELGILLEPGQEATDVGLRRRERDASDLHRAIERMGDGAVRRHHEIAAELGLAPDHDPNRIAGGQHRLIVRRAGLLRQRRDRSGHHGEQGESVQGAHRPHEAKRRIRPTEPMGGIPKQRLHNPCPWWGDGCWGATAPLRPRKTIYHSQIASSSQEPIGTVFRNTLQVLGPGQIRRGEPDHRPAAGV